MKAKKCSVCKKTRLKKFFQRHNKSKDGFSSTCIDCSKRGRPSKSKELLFKQGTLRSREPKKNEYAPLVFELKRKKGETLSQYRGRHAIEWMEKLITIPSGKFAGEELKFDDWNKNIIKDLFGTLDKNGLRRYREAFIEIPRKNGKTFLTSCIVIYVLFNSPKNSEIYSIASDREQAGIIFRMCKAIIESREDLTNACIVVPYSKRIVCPGNGSFYAALSADVAGKFGYNAYLVIYDELHMAKNGELFDVLKRSQGAVEEPLFVSITTAGNNKFSFCYDKYIYAKNVLGGVIPDKQFYSCIFELEQGENWMNQDVWFRVNPGLGKHRLFEEMKQSFERALVDPAEEFGFRQYYLNEWVEGEIKFVSQEQWNDCPSELNVKELEGKTCYCGLDLASVNDLTAFVMVFPEAGIYKVVCRFYIPTDSIKQRVKRDQVKYDVWLRQGFIQGTPGNQIDYEFILNDIANLKNIFEIKEIAFDRWGSPAITPRLQEMELNVIPFGQGFASMSPPTKELQKLILAKQINHGGNPVLSWMMGNVVIEKDAADNIKITKGKSREKVDGAVGLVMGLDRAMRHTSEEGKSVYDSRGIVVISAGDRKEKKEEEKPEEVLQETRPTIKEIWIEKFCPKCGKDFEGEESRCKRCGRYRDWKK